MTIIVDTPVNGITARDIVTGAMRDLGIIGLTESADDEELRYGLEHLDLLLKALAAEGARPWMDDEAVVSFSAGQVEAELVPRPVEVADASVVMSPVYQRKLWRWNAGEYADIPNKAQRGTPVRYDLRFSPQTIYMRLWPVPNVATDVVYTYTREIADVAANSEVDIPQMWGLALRSMLMARLTAFMPQGMPDWVIMQAEIAKQRVLDFDRPESYQMGPLI